MSGYGITGLYFMCAIYGKVPIVLSIIIYMYVCMYVCMYEVGSYTCIEGFRLSHALLNLSLCGSHSCMCVSVSVSVYLHTCECTCAQLEPPPSYLAERIALFEKLKAKYDTEVAAKERSPIKVTLSNGKLINGKAWETTPYDVAGQISKGLADNAVIAKVNGVLWDLDRPLEGDAKVEILKFEDTEGMYVVAFR